VQGAHKRKENLFLKERKMKIAVASMDGREVSGHLGHCPNFLVFEIEGEAVKQVEKRTLGGDGGCQCQHGGLFSLLGDCQAIISGGMGQGLVQMLQSHGIEPVMTDEAVAEKAIEKYLKGTLSKQNGHSCDCHH
jgi:predicted Fe-Mo cluster-binding NifX family protein